MSEQMTEQRQSNDFPRDLGVSTTSRIDRVTSAAVSLLVILVLFLAAVWLMNLEQTLPNVRAPRDTSNSEALPGHALMQPGFHDVDQIDADLNGDWLIQEIGDRDWIATDQPENNFRAVFYGTNLYLHARVGPEAGTVYVRIDGERVGGLPEDEDGSFVDLWAVQAADRPILLASGLAHGEHIVELTSGDDGELALSAFEVAAETPFPWAFVLAYTGIAAGLFAATRQFLLSLSRRPTRGESKESTIGATADS